MSTASFTLTLESTVRTGPAASAPTPSTTMVPSLTSTTESEAATVFTYTVPGVAGSSAQVITITESGPAASSSAPSVVTETPNPSVITETTTIYSGTADIEGAPTSPTVTAVVMTYTVTDAYGAALTTMTMTTDLTYTPALAGVGTSFITVSTVTAMNTVTVHTSSKSLSFCHSLNHDLMLL